MPTAFRPLLGKLIGLLVAILVRFLRERWGLDLTPDDAQAMQDAVSLGVDLGVYVVSAYAAEWLLGVRRMREQHGVVTLADTRKPAPVASSPGAFDSQPPEAGPPTVSDTLHRGGH